MNCKRLFAMAGAALACSLCLFLGSGIDSHAMEATTTMAATTYVHVRDAAGMNGAILGTLSPAEAVTVTGKTNGWYQVEYNGRTAYVYQEYLNFEGSSAEGDVPNGKETDMKATTSVNVRSSAGMGNNIIDWLRPDQEVRVVGKVNGWYKVELNGRTGYVYGDYLTFLTGGESNSSGNTSSNNGFQETQKTVNNELGLRFRSGPSTNADILGAFPKGTVLKVIGVEGDWYKVEHNGTVGYVFGEYLSDGAMDYTQEGQKLTTTTALNLRTSASTNARVIRVIPQGATVTVLSREGDWYIVDYDGDSGAAYGEYLR